MFHLGMLRREMRNSFSTLQYCKEGAFTKEAFNVWLDRSWPSAAGDPLQAQDLNDLHDLKKTLTF